MTFVSKAKEVSLTFRGFESDPSKIEGALGVTASEKGLRGSPIRPGVRTVLKRSFVRFAIQLSAETRLDEAVPSMWSYLGGVDNIREASDFVLPEVMELNLTWPVKFSEEQEGGFLPVAVLTDLSRLKCALTFSFI